MWVLVTSNFEMYYYKNSYVRTTSSKYELNNTQDYLTHLTNNCFQVLSDTYGMHEEGNIISLKDLEMYIRKTKCESYTLEENFFPWAVSHCVDVLLSGQKKMKKVPTSYELFGFDLMIDEDLRVWMIECNTNPHLGTPNELMKKVVPEMLNEMLTIVLDPLVPPKVIPNKYETGNWIIAHNGSLKNKDHVLIKSFYPIKEFALTRMILLGNEKKNSKTMEEEMDSKKKKMMDEEYGIEDKVLRRNVTLRINKTTFNTLDKKKYKAYSIDNIKELIFKHIGQPSIDEFYLGKSIERAFACLANWELYTDEQVRSVIKAIRYVLDTQFDYLTCNEAYLKIMTNVLKAEELRFEVMIDMIDTFCKIMQKKKMRPQFTKSILDMVEFFSRALFFLLKGENSHEYPKALINKLCLGIIQLCEDKDRSVYVPGETNVNELVLFQVLLSGGVLVLLSIKNAFNEDNLTLCIDAFINGTLDYDELKLQKDILTELPDVYTKAGVYDVEKIMELEVSKNMNKRISKTLERAIQLVNQQYIDLFKLECDEMKEKESPNMEKKDVNKDDEESMNEVTRSHTNAPTDKNSSSGLREVDSTPNRLFFHEWIENSQKDSILRELDEILEKKLEERLKTKAREQKKLEL